MEWASSDIDESKEETLRLKPRRVDDVRAETANNGLSLDRDLWTGGFLRKESVRLTILMYECKHTRIEVYCVKGRIYWALSSCFGSDL